MRTLSVRPGQEERDIASGREILQEAIDHPSKTVMIVGAVRGYGNPARR